MTFMEAMLKEMRSMNESLVSLKTTKDIPRAQVAEDIIRLDPTLELDEEEDQRKRKKKNKKRVA